MLKERYPDVEKVVLVMDNLNTHDTALLYTAFPWKRLDVRRIGLKSITPRNMGVG